MDTPGPDMFTHVRIVMGMVIGLAITRLLSGAAGFIQHPQRQRVSLLHALWALAALLELILFWWWDVRLIQGTPLTFRVYVVQIGYAIMLYMMVALLFPDSIAEYKGYEDFFIQRRRWFFAFLASTWVFDLLKNGDPLSRLNPGFLTQAGISLALCAAGMIFRSRAILIGIALIYIARQIHSTLP